MDGANQERVMVDELREEGYPAIRMAASGGGTPYELPDVFFRVGDYYIAAELKSRGRDKKHAYLQSDDTGMLDVVKFANQWGAIPVAVSRWAGDTDFYVLPLRGIEARHTTPSDNISLRKDRRDEYEELFRFCEVLERS